MLPQEVPQILINRESLKHMNFDIELLGDCDVIVNEILLRLEERRVKAADNKELEWSNICSEKQRLIEIGNDDAENILFSNDLTNKFSGTTTDGMNSSNL